MALEGAISQTVSPDVTTVMRVTASQRPGPASQVSRPRIRNGTELLIRCGKPKWSHGAVRMWGSDPRFRAMMPS